MHSEGGTIEGKGRRQGFAQEPAQRTVEGGRLLEHREMPALLEDMQARVRQTPQQALAAPQRDQTVLATPPDQHGLGDPLERLGFGGQDAAERARHRAREGREVWRPEALLQDALARDVSDARAVVKVLLEELRQAGTQHARAGEY